MSIVRVAALAMLLMTSSSIAAAQEEPSEPVPAVEGFPTDAAQEGQGEPAPAMEITSPAVTEEAQSEPAPAVQSVSAAVAQEPVAAVAMQNLRFEPQTALVSVGTTVVWTNFDPFEHSITADDGSLDSGLVLQDGVYALTFTSPGTYSYYCLPHGSPGGGGMAGAVIVS